MIIREMQEKDWVFVQAIYMQALLKGQATFNTECPDYESWNQDHIKECRYVAKINQTIVGWIAISSTSSRVAYRGVVEVSIYVDEQHKGNHIGTKLMHKLLIECEEKGYWCLSSSIISNNIASIALHKKCGFREIGYRERIAKDRFGNWQNTTLMEKRF